MLNKIVYIAGSALFFLSAATVTMRDRYNNQRLRKLHPKIRTKVFSAIKELERKGIYVRIASGFRSFEEQARLYAQGRTVPGTITTKAPPGYSFHNYGLAFDLCLCNSLKCSKCYNISSTKYKDTIVKTFKKYGFAWGGDFKSFYDPNHFEYHCCDVTDLLKKKRAGLTDKNGYVKI